MSNSAGGCFTPDQDQTVSGAWTFSGATTFTGAVTNATQTATTLTATTLSATTATVTGGFVTASEAATTAANLKAYGFSSIVGSTSGGTRSYTLDTPVAGYFKQIGLVTFSVSTAGVSSVTTSTSSTTFDGTSTIASFSSQGYLNLRGVSSTRWAIVGASTTVAFS